MDEREAAQHVMAQFDAPAYVRRARRMQAAFEQLVESGRQQRESWLKIVRVRLGLLHGWAGAWPILTPFLVDSAQLRILQELDAALQPKLRSSLAPTSSARKLRRALRDLIDSISFFNRRWHTYLAQVDLAPINDLREGYNRYYVLEKECAVRLPSLARQGFQPLSPLVMADLIGLLPFLPVPRMKDE